MAIKFHESHWWSVQKLLAAKPDIRVPVGHPSKERQKCVLDSSGNRCNRFSSILTLHKFHLLPSHFAYFPRYTPKSCVIPQSLHEHSFYVFRANNRTPPVVPLHGACSHPWHYVSPHLPYCQPLLESALPPPPSNHG